MRAVSDEEVSAVLAALFAAGVNAYTGMPTGGCIDLSAPQAVAYLKGPDLFWAGYYGVELNRYMAWCEALPDGVRCTHVTRRGRIGVFPCRNWAPAGESPQEFNPESALCDMHARRAKKEEG